MRHVFTCTSSTCRCDAATHAHAHTRMQGPGAPRVRSHDAAPLYTSKGHAATFADADAQCQHMPTQPSLFCVCPMADTCAQWQTPPPTNGQHPPNLCPMADTPHQWQTPPTNGRHPPTLCVCPMADSPPNPRGLHLRTHHADKRCVHVDEHTCICIMRHVTQTSGVRLGATMLTVLV